VQTGAVNGLLRQARCFGFADKLADICEPPMPPGPRLQGCGTFQDWCGFDTDPAPVASPLNRRMSWCFDGASMPGHEATSARRFELFA